MYHQSPILPFGRFLPGSRARRHDDIPQQFSSVIVRVGSGRSLADTRPTTTGNRTEWAVRLNLEQTTFDQLPSPAMGPFSDRGIQVPMSHTRVDGFPEEVGKDVEADAKRQSLDVADAA